MRDAGLDQRAQVVQHVVDRLVRPAEDHVDADRQPQFTAVIDRLEYLRRRLPASARLDQLVVELLHAHADPVDTGRLHRLQLLATEGLRNPLERHLDVARDIEHLADDPHQRGVLIGPVKIGRPAAEVDAGELGAAEVRPEQFAFAAQVPEVHVELLPVAVNLAREEAEAAAIRLRRQAVRRADVEVDPLPHRVRCRAPIRHHVGNRDVPVEPEDGGRVPVKHLVALPPLAVSLDPGTDIRRFRHIDGYYDPAPDPVVPALLHDYTAGWLRNPDCPF